LLLKGIRYVHKVGRLQRCNLFRCCTTLMMVLLLYFTQF